MSLTESFTVFDSVNLKAPTASDGARRLTRFGRLDAVVALGAVERARLTAPVLSSRFASRGIAYRVCGSYVWMINSIDCLWALA